MVVATVFYVDSLTSRVYAEGETGGNLLEYELDNIYSSEK